MLIVSISPLAKPADLLRNDYFENFIIIKFSINLQFSIDSKNQLSTNLNSQSIILLTLLLRTVCVNKCLYYVLQNAKPSAKMLSI